MQSEVNKWIDMAKEAWSDLIYDYRKFGERSGHTHMREENVRFSFLQDYGVAAMA